MKSVTTPPSPAHWFDQLTESGRARIDDPGRCYRVLVADLVGLKLDERGLPDSRDFEAHVVARGARFLTSESRTSDVPGIVFEYQPQLTRTEEISSVCAGYAYDGIIAAATAIPADTVFREGGVRIGAGTANMASQSFTQGSAPLMNTPSFNSRATAQMVFKALLRELPDLPFDELNDAVVNRTFDTGRDLQKFPTQKLEGQRLAVLGFGNIGREVARLGQAFGMQVAVYARPSMQPWIEAEGFEFSATIAAAASKANVLSPHLGLGAVIDGGFANEALIDSSVFEVLAPAAVLINFDRGELVDVAELEVALNCNRVASVAVDADVFESDGEAIGPLQPYIRLSERFPKRVLLLPHAAADTDHPSRVAGAKQAADQMIAAIRYRCVVNGVGKIPSGYTDLGGLRLPGVGRISPEAVTRLAENADALTELRAQFAVASAWLDELDRSDPRTLLSSVDSQEALLALNQLTTTLDRLGLLGPGVDL